MVILHLTNDFNTSLLKHNPGLLIKKTNDALNPRVQENLTFPNGLTEITINDGEYSNMIITNIIFPDSLKSLTIGNHAFSNCKIENLTMSANGKINISDTAFLSSTIQKLVINGDNIPENLFRSAPFLVGTVCFNAVFSLIIEKYAFQYTTLKDISLEINNLPKTNNDIVSFGEHVFQCSELKEISFLNIDRDLILNDYSLEQSKITNITFPKKDRITIGRNVFQRQNITEEYTFTDRYTIGAYALYKVNRIIPLGLPNPPTFDPNTAFRFTQVEDFSRRYFDNGIAPQLKQFFDVFQLLNIDLKLLKKDLQNDDIEEIIKKLKERDLFADEVFPIQKYINKLINEIGDSDKFALSDEQYFILNKIFYSVDIFNNQIQNIWNSYIEELSNSLWKFPCAPFRTINSIYLHDVEIDLNEPFFGDLIKRVRYMYLIADNIETNQSVNSLNNQSVLCRIVYDDVAKACKILTPTSTVKINQNRIDRLRIRLAYAPPAGAGVNDSQLIFLPYRILRSMSIEIV